MLLGLGGTGKTMSSNQARERATNVAPVERWLSRPAGGEKTEDRLASLIRTAGPPAGLGAVARARVWSRLRQRPTSRARIARLRWSVALSVLLTSGVVLGALSARRWWPAKPARNVPGLTPATPHAARGVRGLAQPPVQPPLQPPVDEPVPEAAPPAPPVRASAAPHASQARGGIVAEAEPAAQAEPAALTTGRGPEAISPSPSESAGLDPPRPAPGRAHCLARHRCSARRCCGCGKSAMPAARWPRSMSIGPAIRTGRSHARPRPAHIDALLLLGRNDEALAELGALTLQPVGRDQELRLIRGELAAATDCKRAFVDFDRILNEQATAAVVERALHGRAACRRRTGDETGATRDLTEYLRRFPAGRFAAEARRTLEARREDL